MGASNSGGWTLRNPSDTDRAGRPRCQGELGQLVRVAGQTAVAWRPCKGAGRRTLRLEALEDGKPELRRVCRRCARAFGVMK